MQANSTSPAISTTTDALWPAYCRIPMACHLSGLSRSEIYRRLAAGDIVARKNGTATLIDMDSVVQFLDALPAANIGVAA